MLCRFYPNKEGGKTMMASGRKSVLFGIGFGILFGVAVLVVDFVKVHTSIDVLTPAVNFLTTAFLILLMKIQPPSLLIYPLFFGYWIVVGACFGGLAAPPARRVRFLLILIFSGALIFVHWAAEKKFANSFNALIETTGEKQ